VCYCTDDRASGYRQKDLWHAALQGLCAFLENPTLACCSPARSVLRPPPMVWLTQAPRRSGQPHCRNLAQTGKQDCLWGCFSNLTSFPTRLGHQFLMLHSDNAPFADTAFFTIAMDCFIRREAVVAAVAVMIEETCFCCSAGKRYEGETVSTHHTVQSVMSLGQN